MSSRATSTICRTSRSTTTCRSSASSRRAGSARWSGPPSNRMRARLAAFAVVLMLPGLALVIAGSAGIADVVKHGRRDIGSGTIVDRYMKTFCTGRTTGGCRSDPAVHIRVDRAQATVGYVNDDLYALAGTRGRVPVELEVNTVTHRISRVKADGRWYGASGSDRALLFLLIPLVALGAALVVGGLVRLAPAIGRHLTARRTA